jgi:predicted SprT family Zn-dependent metalloprotease
MPKRGRPRKSYDREVDQPVHRDGAMVAITPVEYGGLQQAFDHFNKALFDGALPDVFLTYQRKAHSFGYFSADRFSARGGEFRKHEVALNPDAFVGQTDQQVCQTLVHEQTHLWQHAKGTAPMRGYHDREWAAKMKSIGLQPSSTGMVGGKETGQKMLDYIISGGRFECAYLDLAATGWKLNLQSAHRPVPTKLPTNSKTKFTCPSCGQNTWAKPNAQLMCLFCFTEFAERLGVTVPPEVDKLVTMVSTESVKTNAAA